MKWGSSTGDFTKGGPEQGIIQRGPGKGGVLNRVSRDAYLSSDPRRGAEGEAVVRYQLDSFERAGNVRLLALQFPSHASSCPLRRRRDHEVPSISAPTFVRRRWCKMEDFT